MRFEETFVGKVVLVSGALGIATVLLKFSTGETDLFDWIAALLLWASASAGVVGIIYATRR